MKRAKAPAARKGPTAPFFQVRKGAYWLQGDDTGKTSGGWGQQSCGNRYATEAEAKKVAKLFPHSEAVKIEEA